MIVRSCEEGLWSPWISLGRPDLRLFEDLGKLSCSDGLEDSREAEKGDSYSRFTSTIGPEGKLVNVCRFE